MCVAALAWHAHPQWPLIVAANRDEYHERPAAPLHVWPDGDLAGLIAGQDLRSGGTWLGVHPARRRLVLVTNFRAPGYPQPHRPSRGALVTALLHDADAQSVAIADYNPFNLFAISAKDARFLTNHPTTRRTPLPPGVHALSNGDFTAPWPKATALSTALSTWLECDDKKWEPVFVDQSHDQNRRLHADDPAKLFTPLADETKFPADEALGNGPEPRFSGIFIRDETYGTRCSTVIALNAAGHGLALERRFAPDGTPTGETRLDFRWGV